MNIRTARDIAVLISCNFDPLCEYVTNMKTLEPLLKSVRKKLTNSSRATNTLHTLITSHYVQKHTSSSRVVRDSFS